MYPVPYSYSSTTLAEQVNYGYDNDGRVTGITDYGYGGLAYGGGYGSGYGGSYGGTFALEEYSLEYDADSRLYGLSNYAHTSDNASYLYDADSELATTLSYGGAFYGGQFAGNDQTSSIYDANGNPTGTGVVIGAGNRLLSDGTYNYTYDAAGNMAQPDDITTHVAMYFRLRRRQPAVDGRDAKRQRPNHGQRFSDLRSLRPTDRPLGHDVRLFRRQHVFDHDHRPLRLRSRDEGHGAGVRRQQQSDEPLSVRPGGGRDFAQESVSSPLGANTTWMVTNYQGSVVNSLWQGDTQYGSDPSSNVSYSPFGQTNFAGGLFFGYTGAAPDEEKGTGPLF